MFRLPDSWLWDFWLAEECAADGERTYHLFFLHASRALHDPDRRHLRAAVGHAVSTDLVTWRQVFDTAEHRDRIAKVVVDANEQMTKMMQKG